MSHELTRRDLLRRAGAAGAAAGLSGLGLEPWVERALAAPRRAGRLKDIEHVVILMQENRSFDHYFGRMPRVRGFSDKRGRAAFRQAGFAGNGGVLEPFHIDRSKEAGFCTHDITHDWGPQHRSWNGGAMDRFVTEHVAADGAGFGPLTMGYYDRADIPFYYRLAEAFTVCDRYHCSVMGPTDPNRLLSMSGTLDPDGKAGGPHVETLVAGRSEKAGTFTWTTMPEQLSARKVSWKIYTSPSGGSLDSVLPYFKRYQTDQGLIARAMKPTYPDDFLADIAHDRLPSVSWVLTSLQASEHPGYSSAQAGEQAARDIVSALTRHQKIWSRTALLITWDENGGFFDHVAPPAPPPGTPGEFLTVANLPEAAQGIRGPIGLGFRVPLLIVSPFSRGGFVCSDVFDHTSMLRFLEARFGAEVPNLSTWRRRTCGDLTTSFNFAHVDTSVPKLGHPAAGPKPVANGGCEGTPKPYPVPPNHMPSQPPGRPRRPSGPVRVRSRKRH